MASRKYRRYKDAQCCGNCLHITWSSDEYAAPKCRIDREDVATFKVCSSYRHSEPSSAEDDTEVSEPTTVEEPKPKSTMYEDTFQGGFTSRESYAVGGEFIGRCTGDHDYERALTIGKEYALTITPHILKPLCKFVGDNGRTYEAHLYRFTKVVEEGG